MGPQHNGRPLPSEAVTGGRCGLPGKTYPEIIERGVCKQLILFTGVGHLGSLPLDSLGGLGLAKK